MGSSPLASRVLTFEATTDELVLTEPLTEVSEAEPTATTAEQPSVSDAAILVEAEYSTEEVAQALASADQPASVDGKEPSPTLSSGLSAFDDPEQPADESAAAVEPAAEEQPPAVAAPDPPAAPSED